MTSLAAQTMARRLTTPFARGASTRALLVLEGTDPTQAQAQAQVARYDFSEYKALFNEDPRPRYILTALQDIPVLTQVSVDCKPPSEGSPPPSITIPIPAGTLAGTSFALGFALDIHGSEEDPRIQIQRVQVSPKVPKGTVAEWWGLTALLGNLAKLLWVIGWEKDHIRRHLALIQAQRHLSQATGYSLDLFGYDLGVPRFPPQPYSYDQNTIALYHLDDLPASRQLALFLLEGTDPTQAQVASYDFSEYKAYFNEAHYILTALQNIPEQTQVSVDYTGGNPSPAGGPLPAVTVPAGTLAGTSFVLDIYSSKNLDIRIQRVQVSPKVPNGTVAEWWGLSAVLRNKEVDQVEDIMKRYGNIGHNGTNTSGLAKSGATGRFGSAFAFRDPNAEIYIAPQDEFDLDTNASFTAECFVKPDVKPDVKPGVSPADGHVLAKHPDPADATKAGWALSIGAFNRDLPLNVRFLLSDGTQKSLSDGTEQPVMLFADQSLTTDRFYHLAGVIDREKNEARLYVDGQLLAVKSIAGLGRLINTEAVRMGRTPVPEDIPEDRPVPAYRGIIDEVRFSSIARSAFHPVLGEEDNAYRQRLEIFERWTLPTPANLMNILNEAVKETGGIGEVLEPFILNDTNAAMAGGTFEFTVEPDALAPGECIDFEGNRRVNEADVNGTSAAEITFDPIFLMLHDDPRATYVPPPAQTLERGELPPDPHKMQVVTVRQLNQLLDLLATMDTNGRLQVVSAFDPRAEDLRAVGRGLLLTHSTLSRNQLAARAHQAGFSFVCNRDDLGAVYASTQPGDYIDITVTPVGTATTPNGFDQVEKQTVSLGIQPALPPDTLYRWLVIPCGAGQASFTPPINRSSVILTAEASGILNVKVEVTYRRNIASGTRTLRIGPLDLADGASIGDDGSQGIEEDVAGQADNFFHPSYLVTHTDSHSRVDYRNNVNNRRMQAAVAQHLDQLLTLLSSGNITGQLQIVQAYVPNASDLSDASNLSKVGRALTLVGRALTLEHTNTTLSAGTLGVLAHAAGFTYVARKGNQILIRQRPGELVRVTNLSTPDSQVVSEGKPVDLTMSPRAKTHGIAVSASAVYVTNSGTDTVSEINPATGQINPARVFKVGWNPVAVALSPDGKLLYTADRGSDTVTVVDLVAGKVVKTVKTLTDGVGRGPVALVHHPDLTMSRLYVACQDDNSLLEIDTAALNILNTLAVGSSPSGIALTPDGSAVWVALSGANQVAIVDTNPFGTKVDYVGLTAPPLKIAIDPNSAKAYASLPKVGSIAVIDVASRAVNTVPVGQTGKTSNPNAVAVAPDNSTVYVTDITAGNERVYFLKPDGLPVLNADGSAVSVRVQQEPLDVVAAGASQNVVIYVVNYGGDETNFGSDVVSVIDPQGKGVTQSWLLGSGLGESLTWVLRLGTASKAHLNSTALPQVTLFGDAAGPVLVRAVYLLRNNAAPYTFEIRLKPKLEAPIRKEQYDLIMNILNAFHPIGVEVITLPIRERVIEVRDQLLNAFPAYTYPNFRMRTPLPHRTRKEK